MKCVVDGMPMAKDERKKSFLVTDHDGFRFSKDGVAGTAPVGQFTIDSSKNPKWVDSTSLSGPEKGQVSLGIYEILDSNTVRACWANPGKPRPTSFNSLHGSGWTVQYWRLITRDVGR